MESIRRALGDGRGTLGWNLLALSLVGAGIAVIAIAAVRDPSGEGFDTTPVIEDVSSPGPLEPRAESPELVSDDLGVADGGPAAEPEGRGGSRGPLWSGDGFRLAAVRKGARVRVWAQPDGRIVETVGDKTEFGSPRVFSVLARRGRWLRVATPISGNEALWIRANPGNLKFVWTDVSVHASLSKRLVEVRRDGKVEQRFTVTIGAPGSDTPPGRWAVTDVVVGGLNPVYGCCAIVLSAHQPNLPPGWIGGDRVAIHGTTGPVGHAASNGCLRAPNDEAQALADAVPLGTPVFISA